MEDESESQCFPKTSMQYVCGLPLSTKFDKEKVLSAINYKPRDDDVIVSSYPKTGTTWVQYIVLQVLHKAELYPSLNDLTFHIAPYMEFTGAEGAERLDPPRRIKYHMPYNLTPRSKSAKYIYTIRNPKDTVVSYYNFVRQMGDSCLGFDEFFNLFLKAEYNYGDYFEHVLSWYGHKDEENILLIHYEELCRDVRSQILKIAEFLGERHVKALEEDSGLFERIVKNTSFSCMKENVLLLIPNKDYSTSSTGNKPEERRVDFFRKGTPGDWRNHLSPEQNRLLDEQIQAKLGKTEMISIWGNTI